MKSLSMRVEQMLNQKSYAAMTAAAIAMLGAATAFTPPAPGDLGYDMYNIVVNQGVLGPIGFMAAVLMIVFGVGSLVRGSPVPGVLSIIAAAAVFAADSVVTTLGFVV